MPLTLLHVADTVIPSESDFLCSGYSGSNSTQLQHRPPLAPTPVPKGFASL